MAAVTIWSGFGAQENKDSYFPLFLYLPWNDDTYNPKTALKNSL